MRRRVAGAADGGGTTGNVVRRRYVAQGAPVAAAFGAVVLAALLFLVIPVQGDTPIDPALAPWWLIGTAFVLAEAYIAKSGGRPEVLALSPHDALVALGLFMLACSGLLAAQLIGAAIALVLLRHSKPVEALTRLASLALATSIALLTFHGIAHAGDPLGPLGWGAAIAAVLAASVTSALFSLFTARCEGRRSTEERFARTLALRCAGSVASSSVAIAALELIRAHRLAALLLLAPFLSGGLVLRAYASERRRLVHLRRLYESMSALHRAPGLEAGVQELLESTRRLLGTDVAMMILFSRRAGSSILVSAATAAGASPLRPSRLSQAQEAVVDLAARSTSGFLLDRARVDRGQHGLLTELEFETAMLTPLRGESGVLGVLLVGEQTGSARRFEREDVRLLDMYGSHAAILLENDRLEESVNELNALKEQLRHQAYHDALTGLPNRALFAERVAQALSDRDSGAAAVLFLDLDEFKMINDSLGHHAGDELLVAVARRVQSCIRDGDVPARLGGDEFAVLAPGGSPEDAERIAERLVKSLEEPFTIDGRETPVHASVGIAYGHPGMTSADELLRNADVAMYGAKQKGKRRYQAYEPHMHLRVRRRQELTSALERAVERGEIAVHYQPIVDLESRRIVAFEALARWERPHHGLLGATSFIPLADEMGLMVDIGRVVLREACRAARSWQSAFPGHTRLGLNVNLAPSELHDRRLADEVAAVLEETNLDPGTLVLEITESGVMQSPEQARRTMSALRDIGVSLALDDFGTGHSSLAYLRDFPIDTLKIAREFVSGLPAGHVDTVFVDAIVTLAQSLGLNVVAEGIESERQAEAVALLGCRLGQGYFFGSALGQLGIATYLSSEGLPLEPAQARVA